MLDDILTAPLEVLLRDKDDDLISLANMLRCSCQGVFKQALKTNPSAALTAGRILESAYLWVFGTRIFPLGITESGVLHLCNFGRVEHLAVLLKDVAGLDVLALGSNE